MSYVIKMEWNENPLPLEATSVMSIRTLLVLILHLYRSLLYPPRDFLYVSSVYVL